MSGSVLVLAPLRIEARAIRAGARLATVERVGMGPARAAARARSLRASDAAAVAVMGLGGGLVDGVAVGDVVVADRVLDETGTVVAELAGAALLAAELRAAGLVVHVGAVASTDHVVAGQVERAELAARGAIVVDMESSALLASPWDRPTAVVRAVSDAPGAELASVRLPVNLTRSLRSLRRAAPVVQRWAAACGPRRVLLASPRSFCAGVERAIATVGAAIERFGPPVYVRRQIVHNDHVVAELRSAGAVFVRELSEVPDGATVVFSAHGVGAAVRAEADRKQLQVVDATCPLVAKVHSEVRRFAGSGHRVVLIGHAGHDEVEGTLGEVPGISLVENPDQVASLPFDDDAPVAYTTQTTLAPDEVEATIAALRDRFGEVTGPRSSDICYATHNRQEAIAVVAGSCELVLVVGSATSSNSRRLVEVARRAGAGRCELVNDELDVRLDWLAGVTTLGVTAGASAPDILVQRVVDAVGGLGPLDIVSQPVRREAVSFALPLEVR